MILMLYLMQRDGYQGEKDPIIGARGRIKREILVSNAFILKLYCDILGTSTVESHEFGTRGFIRIISIWNYREVDIKYI